MPDLSELDSRYFISSDTYNCPFCNRRNVKFSHVGASSFDWTDKKRCHFHLVRCSSCKKTSLHLSFTDGLADNVGYGWSFNIDVGDGLDDEFFYSVPTSFFALDSRIPSVLRELFTEAEGCLKSNYLTGASACARKIVYELAEEEGAEGDHYEDRIKSLKGKLTHVDPSYFDNLLTIQELASNKVHEEAYDGWESKHLRMILTTLKDALDEVYVIPKLKQERREKMLKMREELKGSGQPPPEGTAPEESK